MFEQGKIAKVFEACEGSGCDGYLVARIGDRVEVLHYESSAEGDWVYARNAVYKSRSGWMPASALQPPKQTRFYPWLKLLFEEGKIANVFETCQNSESDGYLVARIGDQVEVLHYESNAEGDWVYARDAVCKGRSGWMPVSALQPAKQRRFYVWRKLLFEQGKIANVFERSRSLASALVARYNLYKKYINYI